MRTVKTSFKTIIAVLAVGGVFPLSNLCAQGMIEARLTVGERVTDLRYSRQGDIVRIEEKRATAPSPPVTLLNVKTGDATICFRHNSTFLRIPSARLSAKLPVPGLPMAEPAMHPTGQPAPAVEGMPAFPAMPEVPGSPPMPAFPGMSGQLPAANLERAGESRSLHGVNCAKYTASDPEEGTLEVWAADDLFPFFLPLHEAPRDRGRREFVESWPEMIREQGLFPMLATLRMEDRDTVVLRFEVTAFDRETEGVGPFEVPKNFSETAPSTF